MRQLIQMIPNARPKDAMGRMALALCRLSRQQNYRSWILTEKQSSLGFGDFRLGPVRKGALSWVHSPPDVLVYHHSIGSQVAECFLRQEAKQKVLIYHNITPPDLASGSSSDLQWGLDQLPRLVAETDVQVGLSQFSCSTLEALGGENVVKLPYLLWERGTPKAKKNKDGAPIILVVGRVVPFKSVLESIKAFHEFSHDHPSARLFVAGKCDRDYEKILRDYVSLHRLGSRVRILGKVSDGKLHRLYGQADILLTLSEHEGFCVPILEALRSKVAVVAYGAGAVSETLGEGGFVLRSKEPRVVASAMETVLRAPKTFEMGRGFQIKRLSLRSFTRGFFPLLEPHGA